MVVDILKILPIVIAIFSAIIAYFTTLHKLKDYFRDKLDEQNKVINDLKVEIANLKNKDEIQQLIIDSLKKDLLSNLPNFQEVFKQIKK